MVIQDREGAFCSGFDPDELQGDLIGTTTAFEIVQPPVAAVCAA